jgi:hypothetical protein
MSSTMLSISPVSSNLRRLAVADLTIAPLAPQEPSTLHAGRTTQCPPGQGRTNLAHRHLGERRPTGPRDPHGSGHTEHATACAAVRWPTLRPAEMLTLPSPAHQRVDELRTVRPVPRDDALNWDDPRYPCHVARPDTPKGASRALT